MKHLSILVPKGQVIVDTIIGTYNMFLAANDFYKKNEGDGEVLFSIDLVGVDLNDHDFGNFFSIHPNKSIDDLEKSDLIIVPGLVGNMENQIEKNQLMISWIKKQRVQNNAEVASLCRGAFLLAATGLMHGKTCATHWLSHDKFHEMFPEVNLIPDRVICEENGIYSSGGAYSYLNLVIHLVEKYFGREVALWCAKIGEIEFDRTDQNQFVIFNGQKDHADEGVLKLQEYIEHNFEEKIIVEELASMVATSSRHLLRRFKKATNNSPAEYIQRVRVEAAKKKLESSTLTINEVMYDCGYSDSKAFRTIFKRYSGLSPIEYRKKYNRELAFA